MAPTSVSEISKTATSLSSASSSELDLSLRSGSGISKKGSPASLLRHPSDLLLTTADNLKSSSEFPTSQQLPLDFSIRSNASVTSQHGGKILPNLANASQSTSFSNFLRPPFHNLLNFPHPLFQALQKQSFFNQRLVASNRQRLDVAPNRMAPTSQDIHLMRLEQQIGNLTHVVNQLAANQARFIHLPQRVQALEQMVTRMASQVDLCVSKQFSSSMNNTKSSSCVTSSTSSQRSSTVDSSANIQEERKLSLPSLLIPNMHDEVEKTMKNDPMTSRSTSSAVDSIMNEVNNNSAESDSFEDSPFDLRSNTSTTSDVSESQLPSDLAFTAGVPRSILSEIFPGNKTDTKAMKYILPSHIPIEELRPNCKVHSVRIGPFVAPMDIFNVPPGEFEPVFRKYRSGSAFSQALFVLHHGSFLAMKSSASERGRNNQRILSNDFIHELTQVCRFWFPEADDDSVAKAVNQKQRNILCSARHCFFYLKCEVCSEAKQETLKALKMKFEQYQNSQF